MDEEAHPHRRRSDWTTDLHAKVDLQTAALDGLKHSILEMTKASNNSIRLVYQMPLACVAMYLAWLALDGGKIGEPSFMGLFLVCLFPFFGDGIQKLRSIGVIKNQQVASASKVLFLLIAFGFLLTGYINTPTQNQTHYEETHPNN